MKKIALATLVTILAIFAFTACGGDDDDKDKKNNNGKNQAPTANAGTDFEHNITTSGTTVTLSGSGTDTDGTIAGYTWTCTDWPNGSAEPTFSNSAIANPTVSGFDTLGDYEFSLKVKDNENKESTADVVKVSLVRTASKNVEVSFETHSSGASINFTPSYSPNSSWGDNFSASDITYTVTCAELSKTYTSETGFNINASTDSYTGPATYTFTQTFKDSSGEVIGTQVIKADVSPMNTFPATLKDGSNTPLTPNTIPSIDITLSKKVSTGAITTTLDTTVSFVSLAETYPATTIDFSPTALPDGVTYILTDNNSTPQKRWELYKDGFNGKVAVSNYDTAGLITFTQTFYLYGEEITGTNSKRTVTLSVVTGFVTNFGGVTTPDSGTVTLKYP